MHKYSPDDPRRSEMESRAPRGALFLATVAASCLLAGGVLVANKALSERDEGQLSPDPASEEPVLTTGVSDGLD